MSKPINLNLFTKLNAEGGCSQANKTAFQTMNFTPRTSKEVVDNMKRLADLAADPEYKGIEYGKPFYLPCIVTEANEVSAADGVIDGIMQADGSLAETGLEAPAEADADEPF